MLFFILLYKWIKGEAEKKKSPFIFSFLAGTRRFRHKTGWHLQASVVLGWLVSGWGGCVFHSNLHLGTVARVCVVSSHHNTLFHKIF